MRVCGLRARVRCLRACGFACVRRAACGCGVGARALAVQLTTVHTFCDGHSEAGEFVDVEVREFVGVRKRKECPQVATPSEEPIPVEIYWFTKSCCLSEVKKFTYPRTTHTHT